jgi:Ca2+-binding RTX toxin-like protein
MSGRASGGNDTFTGGAHDVPPATNLAYGDALTISGHARGGNDVLTGGADATPPEARTFDNTLIGDAQTMSGSARGGNDKLISGTGNDDMWGDAQQVLGNAQGGNDVFAFGPNNGHDMIEDFGQGASGGQNLGVDHIDVSALGVHDFNGLTVSSFSPATHESTISFGADNDLIVRSQVALTSHNFIFAT